MYVVFFVFRCFDILLVKLSHLHFNLVSHRFCSVSGISMLSFVRLAFFSSSILQPVRCLLHADVSFAVVNVGKDENHVLS